ncbi:MAG: hypothetical protein QM722_19725 [Piscinibacter sp.]
MLLLQALGLWHGVVHAGGLAAVAHAHAHAAGGERFAAHDDGDAQCRLYDQLAHADLAFADVAIGLAARVGETLGAAVPAGRLAPQAAGFLARGPPLTA